MINTDPALILNRATPDPLSPAISITVDTPCPRCGMPLERTPHFEFDVYMPILSHCRVFAIEGDDIWVNADACERTDPMPFIRIRAEALLQRSRDIRAEAMKPRTVSV